MRPVPSHIDVRKGIAAGSAVGYSPDTRRQFSEWIASGGYDHFVTLASNDSELRSARRHLIRGRHGTERMVALAKAWEGRVNRYLLGPRWAAPHKRSERLQAFYVLERAVANPHWHVLARIDEPDPVKHAVKTEKFREQVGLIWTSIILSGSTNLKDVYDEGVTDYVAKELGRDVSCDLFIPPGFFDLGG